MRALKAVKKQAVPSNPPPNNTNKDRPRADSSGPEDRLLTIKEAALFLGIAEGTLYHWACRSAYEADPVPTRHLSSRCLRFPADELKAWAKRRDNRRNGVNTKKGGAK